MTEAEWLNGQQPDVLVKCLCETYRLNRTKAGRRKLWLFACACCRRVWKLFESEPSCAAVVVAAERFADGEVPFSEVQSLGKRLHTPSHGRDQSIAHAARSLAYTSASVAASNTAICCASAASYELIFPSEASRYWAHELAQDAHLLRCMFGNPFRPVTFDPTWRTSDVVALARGIYDNRAFDRMPILADALQDAGCTNDDILNHSRDPHTPHARGCWVVDLVLGFS